MNNSTDIFVPSLIDRYIQGHGSLHEICLAEYAAFYDLKRSTARTVESENYAEIEEDEGAERRAEAQPNFAQLEGHGSVKLRTKAKIIRWRNFS